MLYCDNCRKEITKGKYCYECEPKKKRTKKEIKKIEDFLRKKDKVTEEYSQTELQKIKEVIISDKSVILNKQKYFLNCIDNDDLTELKILLREGFDVSFISYEILDKVINEKKYEIGNYLVKLIPNEQRLNDLNNIETNGLKISVSELSETIKKLKYVNLQVIYDDLMKIKIKKQEQMLLAFRKAKEEQQLIFLKTLMQIAVKKAKEEEQKQITTKKAKEEELIFLKKENIKTISTNFVNVDNKFLISKYQVTQKEYTEIMGKNPAYNKGDNYPVEQVSLYDAMEYCNKKSIKEGLQLVYKIDGENTKIDRTKNGYRLPTEEEWKYAAKGGSLSKGFTYSGSNNPDEVAWYNSNSGNKTHEVGTKKPNELGIYDMSGNVWEWTDTISGVLFGGAWLSNVSDIRVESRFSFAPSIFYHYVGFRCVQLICNEEMQPKTINSVNEKVVDTVNIKAKEEEQRQITVKKAKEEEQRQITVKKAKEEEQRQITVKKAKEEEQRQIAVKKAKEEEQRQIAIKKVKEEEQKQIAIKKVKEEEQKQIAVKKAKEEEQKQIAIKKAKEEEQNQIAIKKVKEEEQQQIAIKKVKEEEQKQIAVKKAKEEEQKQIAVKKAKEEEEKQITVKKAKEEEQKQITIKKAKEEEQKQITTKKAKEEELIFLKKENIKTISANFVNVDNKFLISKYQVTQKEYTEIMGKNPAYHKGDNYPVENVSLYDAMEYCNKKSIKEGLQTVYKIDGKNTKIDRTKNGYRLPTEEEWKYAAKGGSLSKGFTYSGSNNPDEVAWYYENSEYKTHEVGTKKPNELGIYDMSGNVWEWVDTISGVIFGGGFNFYAYDLRVDSRHDYNVGNIFSSVGFRCVQLICNEEMQPKTINSVNEKVVDTVNIKAKEEEQRQIAVKKAKEEELIFLKKENIKTISANFVNVDNKFLISKYQVTQKEYTEIMGKNPAYNKGDNYPVEQVSLYDAMEYCNKKSIKEGLQLVYKIDGENTKIDRTKNGYRLPTEEEWKYAAKGGSLSKGFTYSGSNNPDEVAWYEKNSGDETHEVGTKKPNELGIYDMSGNVWEWVDIIFGIVFGGGFYTYDDFTRMNSCFEYYPNSINYGIGFRCVQSIVKEDIQAKTNNTVVKEEEKLHYNHSIEQITEAKNKINLSTYSGSMFILAIITLFLKFNYESIMTFSNYIVSIALLITSLMSLIFYSVKSLKNNMTLIYIQPLIFLLSTLMTFSILFLTTFRNYSSENLNSDVIIYLRYFTGFFISFLAFIQLIVSITENLNNRINKMNIIRKVFLISFVSSIIIHISLNFLEIGNIQHFIFFGIILSVFLIVYKMKIIDEFLSYQNSLRVNVLQCISVIAIFTLIIFEVVIEHPILTAIIIFLALILQRWIDLDKFEIIFIVSAIIFIGLIILFNTLTILLFVYIPLAFFLFGDKKGFISM